MPHHEMQILSLARVPNDRRPEVLNQLHSGFENAAKKSPGTALNSSVAKYFGSNYGLMTSGSKFFPSYTEEDGLNYWSAVMRYGNSILGFVKATPRVLVTSGLKTHRTNDPALSIKGNVIEAWATNNEVYSELAREGAAAATSLWGGGERMIVVDGMPREFGWRRRGALHETLIGDDHRAYENPLLCGVAPYLLYTGATERSDMDERIYTKVYSSSPSHTDINRD